MQQKFLIFAHSNIFGKCKREFNALFGGSLGYAVPRAKNRYLKTENVTMPRC